jgi:hypothetical protein
MKMSELKVNKITDMVCDLNEQEILDVVLFCEEKLREERKRLSREGKKKRLEQGGIFLIGGRRKSTEPRVVKL